jgi:hypothetical protein
MKPFLAFSCFLFSLSANSAFAQTSAAKSVVFSIVQGAYDNFPSDSDGVGSDFQISFSFTSGAESVLRSDDLVLNLSSPSLDLNVDLPAYTNYVGQSTKIDFMKVELDRDGRFKADSDRAVLLVNKNNSTTTAGRFKAMLLFIGQNVPGRSPRPSYNFTISCPNR